MSSDIFVIRTLKDQVPIEMLLAVYNSLFITVHLRSVNKARILVYRGRLRIMSNLGFIGNVMGKFTPCFYILQCLIYVN